jgi:hypothetical protein
LSGAAARGSQSGCGIEENKHQEELELATGPTAPGSASPVNQVVEEILGLEYWDKAIYDSMEGMTRRPDGSGFNFDPTSNPRVQKIARRRAELLALSTPELLQLRDRVRAKRDADNKAAAEQAKQRREAAAQAKEQQQFYNRPEARADFAFWLKLDYWTLDEAVALLLGKDPRVVTWAAVSKALDPPRLLLAAPPVPSQFLRIFRALRSIAVRSDVMTAGDKLRPSAVASWAAYRIGMTLPEPLRPLVDAPPMVTGNSDGTSPDSNRPFPDARPAAEAAALGPGAEPVLVKRAALRKLVHRWPTVDSDLRHSDRNGLAEAAKASEHGMWREQDALEWARRNGKLTDLAPSSVFDLRGRVFRSED